MVRASRPAARSSATAWWVGGQRDHVAAGIELAARGGVQRGGLAEPGRRDQRRAARHPRRTGRAPRSAWSAPKPLGFGCDRPVDDADIEPSAPGVAVRAWRPARSRSSTRAVLDGGPFGRPAPCPRSGTSRTTSSEARNRSARATISSVVSRPAEQRGDAFDDVGLAEPGVARAQARRRGRPAPRTTRHRPVPAHGRVRGRRPGHRPRRRARVRPRRLRRASGPGAARA